MPFPATRWLLPLCLLLGVLLPAKLFAQLDVVMVYGTVKDMSTAKKLDGVTVTVFKNGAKLVEVTTNASGKYEVNLDYGAEYKIMCSKPNYVGKNISIDTRNVPEEDRQGGHGMNIDFTMMVEIQGVDFSILLEPFGKSEYAKSSGTFEWDHEYTARMRDAQARLLKEYENRKKREANAEAEYAKAMKQGNDAMNASDYKKAVAQFTDALDIKPGDPVATAKLSDARMRLEDLEGEKKLNDHYAALIKEGDALFSKKDYETARSKYTEALDLKDEAHPKQRIKEIEGLLADLARKAEEEKQARELQEKYDAAVKAADDSFKNDELDQAQSKYTEASGLKPDEKYPKDQLTAIATRRAELARKLEEEQQAKALQEKYDAMIKAADAAFGTAKWDEATAKYSEASTMRPEEKYPKDQLAAIQAKKEEEARKAEEERLAKDLQEKYQAAITAGDAAFKSGDLDGAVAKFNEALSLKAEEKYPKDQLAAIEAKRKELALKEEEERKAKELNEQYQSVIAAADAAYNANEWEQATSKYTEASGLKPTESYPKDQLAAIERRKAELAKQAEEEQKARELEENYRNALAAADAAFDTDDWSKATAGYEQAGALKPAESYPKERLALIQKKIAEAEKQRELEELNARYDAAIAEADKGFNSGDLANARTKYMAASEIKPAETYPKQRIGEIDAAIAEQARLAEEERKKQEFETKYNDLITRADKAYNDQQLSAALNDYKDALQMKPDQEHPKSRIASIEQQLDAAAQETAEKERLLREEQEREKRYQDIIAAADKAFDADDLQKARTEYGSALELKSGERHPQQRIAAIDDMLAKRAASEAEEKARQEEEARLAAEREARELAEKAERERLAALQEAEERARREEAERLAMEESAAERAKREEEERRAREAAEDARARYNAHIAAADRAFSGNEFDLARQKYNDALAVDPDAQHPKARLVAIDEAIAAAEQRKLNAKEQEEADRLAREAELKRLEDERLALEMEEAEARRRAEEEERLKREGEKAVEERYNNAIAEADLALAEKRYQEARGLFAQASDIKPQENYPLSKIDQIDKILADLEQDRQAAELAAQKAAKPAERPSNTIDIRKEQEAEQFMRAAKEREDAAKLEQILKFKSEVEQQEHANAEKAAERRMDGVAQRDRHLENSVGLYTGDEGRRLRNAEEMEAQRELWARAEAERRARAASKREENLQQNQVLQQQKTDRDQEWDRKQQEQAAEIAKNINEIRSTEEDRSQRALEKNIELKEQADALAQSQIEMRSRGDALVQERHRKMQEEKRSYELREAQLANMSELSRTRAKEELDILQRDLPSDFADHNRSKLASEFPPGVNEESYTEGNKVIIRRVVVMGNRADEYSKVIAKWGTFYFKNGQSITEAMWSKETELH